METDFQFGVTILKIQKSMVYHRVWGLVQIIVEMLQQMVLNWN